MVREEAQGGPDNIGARSAGAMAGATVAALAPRPTLLLREVLLVDDQGGREGELLLHEGRIAGVGTEVDVADVEQRLLGSGSRLVERDCGGLTVLPGLIDCHVHLVLDASADVIAGLQRPIPELVLQMAQHAAATLAGGVTTVRDLGSMQGLDRPLQVALQHGWLLGPRMVAAGPALCIPGGHGHFIGREVADVAAATQAADESLAAGCEVLKVIATGGVLTPGVDPHKAEMTLEQMAAVVAAAKKAKTHVAAHAHGTLGIVNAVQAGCASIEHGTYMDDAAAALMAQQGTLWVPTIKAVSRIVTYGRGAGIPEFAVTKGEEALQSLKGAFSHARKHKVPVAMGTDAGTPFNHHGENAQELMLLVQNGYSAQEAITAATSTAARLLGLQRRIGRLEKGMEADLLLVRGDPLADIGVVAARPRMVLRAGRIVVDRERWS